MSALYYDYVDTPIGSLLLAGDGEYLIELGFPSGKMAPLVSPFSSAPGFQKTISSFHSAVDL